jgi:ankyrin repeat protein
MSRYRSLSAVLAGLLAALAASVTLVTSSAAQAQTKNSAPAQVLGGLAQNELPIHEAARLGNRLAMEKLLRENPAQRDTPTDYGSTPLHLAAMNADPGPLQALLAAKANLHARDQEGSTPLHMAAYTSRTKNAQLLLEAGADPTLKNNIGRDVGSMARKVRADELAGIVSLWILKGCKPGKPC